MLVPFHYWTSLKFTTLGSSLPLRPSVLGSLAKDSSQYTSEVYFQVRKMVNKTPLKVIHSSSCDKTGSPCSYITSIVKFSQGKVNYSMYEIR